MQKIDFEKIEASADLIAGFDEHLNVAIWNRALAEKYRLPSEQALGKNILDLFPNIKDDFRLQCFRESLAERKAFFFSYLPFAFEPGNYSQLIMPLKELPGNNIISIVRAHGDKQRFHRQDLLKPILAGAPVMI